MKKSIIYRFTAILAVLLTLMVACTEDIADVRLDPVLSTSEVFDIASDKATVIGFVVAEGDGFTERGICYSTTSEPTIDDNKVVYKPGLGGITKATFEVTLSHLDYATTYYAKAYAISDAATVYGSEITFTTLPIVPTVTTAGITDITFNSASGGGEVTANGGADVIAYGLCWSTDPAPTINDSYTTDGDGIGTFTSALEGLRGTMDYYVRAYATNSAGTGYGAEVTFKTLVPPTKTWYVPGSYVAASYPGTGWADWAPDKSPIVKSGISAPDNLEGYIYMATASNYWKFATQPNWDGPNYGDDGDGTISEAGGDFNSPAGYYFIQADAGAMTYSATAMVWGIIGDATPNEWNDETALTYNPELQQWIGAFPLTDAAMKFRANHSWDYNYGSDAADGTLQAGGENISIDAADDYAITLDLSTPLAYTYMINRWGLIGDATPGSWDSDTNMSWDAGNGVFTLTVDLTAGNIKFRANDDWGYNLGGDINALTPGGADIAISTAGNYTITLDPWNMVATVTMN